MKRKDVVHWFEEHRDTIIVIMIVVAIVVSVILGLRMQQNYAIRQRLEEEAKKKADTVQLRTATTVAAAGEEKTTADSASFFLKPSPDEVLSLVKEMGETELPPASQKYTGLRVMWPAYFFQAVPLNGEIVALQLDVSEDGFGVVLETDVDTTTYPRVNELERGQKIWVAGEILGVEGTGTGTILIKAEQLRFEEEMTGILGTSEMDRTGATTADNIDEQPKSSEGEAVQ